MIIILPILIHGTIFTLLCVFIPKIVVDVFKPETRAALITQKSIGYGIALVFPITLLWPDISIRLFPPDLCEEAGWKKKNSVQAPGFTYLPIGYLATGYSGLGGCSIDPCIEHLLKGFNYFEIYIDSKKDDEFISRNDGYYKYFLVNKENNDEVCDNYNRYLNTYTYLKNKVSDNSNVFKKFKILKEKCIAHIFKNTPSSNYFISKKLNRDIKNFNILDFYLKDQNENILSHYKRVIAFYQSGIFPVKFPYYCKDTKYLDLAKFIKHSFKLSEVEK